MEFVSCAKPQTWQAWPTEHDRGVRTERREYTHPNLNERLISYGNLVTGFEDVAFAAPRVQELHGMLVIDLLTQPIHINLNRVRERIEGIVPDMRSDLRARYQLAGAARQEFQQRI